MPSKLILICIVTVCLYSCSAPRHIYTPAPPNEPFFREKGESKLAGYYSGGSGRGSTQASRPYNRGYDLQGAYAISNNWALTASHYNRKEQDVYNTGYFYNYFDSSLVRYKRNITDIGAGYFVKMDNKGNIFFSIYGGIGKGKLNWTDQGTDESLQPYLRNFQIKLTKYFIQPSFNFYADELFCVGFTGRISIVRFGRPQTDYLPEEYNYFFLGELQHRTIAIVEPTFHLQLAIPSQEWIKFVSGITFATDPVGNVSRLKGRNFNGSIGLNFDLFSTKKKK